MIGFVYIAAILAVACCFLLVLNARLRRKVAGLVGRVRVLDGMVYVDELTRIGNLRMYVKEIAAAVSHKLRTSEPLTLLLLDVNEFKAINDEHGHQVGDEALRFIAERLFTSFRPTDTVCRIGGDEFAVIMRDCDLVGAQAATARFVSRLASSPLETDTGRIPIRVSIGGTALGVSRGRVTVGSVDIGPLLREAGFLDRVMTAMREAADRNLYAAKERKGEDHFPILIE